MAMELPERIPRRSHAKSSSSGSGHGRSHVEKGGASEQPPRTTSRSNSSSHRPKSERATTTTTTKSSHESGRREKSTSSGSRGRLGQSALDVLFQADQAAPTTTTTTTREREAREVKPSSRSRHRARKSHSVDSRGDPEAITKAKQRSSNAVKTTRKSSSNHGVTRKDGSRDKDRDREKRSNGKSTRGSRSTNVTKGLAALFNTSSDHRSNDIAAAVGKSKHVRSNSCDSRRVPEPPKNWSSSKRNAAAAKQLTTRDDKDKIKSKSTRGSRTTTTTTTTLDQKSSSSATRGRTLTFIKSAQFRSNSCDSRLSSDKPETTLFPIVAPSTKNKDGPSLKRSNSGPTNYADDKKKPQEPEPEAESAWMPSEPWLPTQQDWHSQDAVTRRSHLTREREEVLCYHDSARSSLPDEPLPSLLEDLLVRTSQHEQQQRQQRGRLNSIGGGAASRLRGNSLDSRKDEADALLLFEDSPSPEQMLYLFNPNKKDQEYAAVAAARKNKILRSKSFDNTNPSGGDGPDHSLVRRSGSKKSDFINANNNSTSNQSSRDRRSSLGYRDASSSPKNSRSIRNKRSSDGNGDEIPSGSLRGSRRPAMDDGDEIPTGSLRGRRSAMAQKRASMGKVTTANSGSAMDARKSIRHSRSFDPKKTLEGEQQHDVTGKKANDDMACFEDRRADDQQPPLQRTKTGSTTTYRSNGTAAERRQINMMGRLQTIALLDNQMQIKEEHEQHRGTTNKKVAEIQKAFKLSSHACSQLASKSTSVGAKFSQLPALAVPGKAPADVALQNKLASSSSHGKSRSKIADKGIQSLVQKAMVQLDDETQALTSALLVSKTNSSIRRSRSSISSNSTATTLNNSLSSTMHSLRSTSTTSSSSTGNSFGNSFASVESNSSEARKRLMAKAQRMKDFRDSFRSNTSAQEKSQRQERSSTGHISWGEMYHSETF